MTGALLEIDIRGRDGLTLAEKWRPGRVTYLGAQTSGFPNLFIITGPGSPSVLTNMVVSIEQHVEWVADCIAYLRRARLRRRSRRRRGRGRLGGACQRVATTRCCPSANSWYMGANIPGKPRVFMPYTGGVGAYRAKAERVAADGYAGFTIH